MSLDNRIAVGDLSGLLALLQTKEARNIPISRKKLPKLLEMFQKCENESIRQSFLVSGKLHALSNCPDTYGNQLSHAHMIMCSVGSQANMILVRKQLKQH